MSRVLRDAPLLEPARLGRALLALGLLLATLVTLAPLLPLGPAPTARAQSGAGPVEGRGRWITIANGDRINRILRDGQTAWAATEGGGLVRWDLQSYEYRQYLAPQDGLPSNQVHDVERTADGAIWLATEAGLARLDPLTERVETFTPESSEGMPARVVTALEAVDDGSLWVGFAQRWDPEMVNRFTSEPGAFRGGGLARFDPSSGSWVETYSVEFEGERNQEKYKSIPSENITDIEFGSDGLLWVGTRPYHAWDDSACFDNAECKGFWVLRGGGLAAHDGQAWSVFAALDGTGGCFSNHITDLEADVDGRMWVATNGRGVLLMRFGMRRTSCNSGQAYYVRGRSVQGEIIGMQGNLAYSVAVNQDGRVWIGHASDPKTGRGAAILQHNGTFDDSSGAGNAGADSDDQWEILQIDGIEGPSPALITAMDLSGDIELIGTKDNQSGDGVGLRAYDAGEDRWTPMRTADTGLPSNQIADISVSPANGDLWVSTANHGVARFDGQAWRSWRMFGAGERVAEVTLDLREGASQLPVDIDTLEAFESIFPGEAYLRLENDPNFYRVVRYIAPRAGLDGQIRITPPVALPVTSGAGIWTVDRGPASDVATQVDVDAEGRAWVGGGETVWIGDACAPERAAIGQCWLDGGLGRFDDGWKVFSLDNSPMVDNMILAVEIDSEGRVWASMSNEIASGYGIAIYDPASDGWTIVDRQSMPSGQKYGGNGVSDLALDPDTGDMWTSHHSVVEWVQNIGGNWDRIFLGGGVARWSKADGRWTFWGKRSGSPLRAHNDSGTDGEMTAVLVDRSRDRVWAGAWDSDVNFHWINGYGVHAAVNWCPLDNCTGPDWQSKVWLEDGKVSALALDAEDNLWVGTTRNRTGLIPPEGGVKLFDGSAWHALTPGNTPLVDIAISALEPDPARERMWVGSQYSGISLYEASAAPTPTSEPSPTALGSGTPTGTVAATPTPMLTAATPTVDPTLSATLPPDVTPSATSRPTQTVEGCPPLRIYLPMSLRSNGVPPDPLHWPEPTPVLRGPCPTATPTSTPIASVTPTVATPTASATPVGSTPTATATATLALSATPGATATGTASPAASATSPGPSATPTATGTPSPTLQPTDPATTATPRMPALGDWTVFSPPDVQLPRESFYDVTSTGPSDVWFVGDAGTVLHWDGRQLTSVSANSQAALRSIVMLAPDRGYIAGDGGTLLQLRSRRWSRANTGSYTDDWAAISAVDGSQGPVAWVLGSGRGNRLRLVDAEWVAPSPADRNTGHSYSDLAVVGESLAYAIQGGTGSGRIYRWDGQEWGPMISTGALFGLHVPAIDLGMAVGPRGTAWWLSEPAKWERMPSQPATSGEDLQAVSIQTRNRAFAGGGRASIFHWNGERWSRMSIGGTHRNRGITAIWMAPDGAEGWAVGEDGLILRYE